MSVRVVTDSNTMIPPSLAASLAITVVPLTATIGGDELVEDDQLDLATAYRRLRAGEPATTSAPSPGAFVDRYRALGAGPIVSIHLGSSYSATLEAARLAARVSGADVTVVDTELASFLAGCCVLAAAEAAAAGADASTVVAAAERTSELVTSIFTLAELDRAAAGGRLVAEPGDGVPVLAMSRAGISTIATASTADEAAALMLDRVCASPGPMRVGVGDADAGPVVDRLADAIRDRRPDHDVIRYAVGPTVAVHAGMGTFGVVYHPR